MKKRFTLPGDTIPLANTIQDIQDALLAIKDLSRPTPAELRKAMGKIAAICAEPALNSTLDRILPDRRYS